MQTDLKEYAIEVTTKTFVIFAAVQTNYYFDMVSGLGHPHKTFMFNVHR